jgi:HlyD family secretion protein
MAALFSTRQKPAVAREFQPPALALEDAAPPRAVWWLFYALAAFVFAAVAWASLAHVDEIVTARGELVTTTPNLVVQPLERVGVKSINVKVGDIVRKGDLLATLDPTFTEADLEQTQTKLASLSARQARLEAEIARTDFVPPHEGEKSMRAEVALYNERRLTYASKLKSFDDDLAKATASLASTQAGLEKLKARAELLRRIVDMRQTLVAQAHDSQLRLIEAQSQLIAAENEVVQAEGRIEEMTHQIDAVSSHRKSYIQEWREKVADELVSVRRDRQNTTEELNKAIRRRDLVSLAAPEDSIVLEIAQRTIGSVLREAEVLFTLVPLGAQIEADVRISPSDIGRVHSGDEARIKFDAFPFQRHGTSQGRITTISGDAFRSSRSESSSGDAARNEATAPFHRARVALVDTHLRNTPPGFRLLPGMTVSAEIKVGSRRVISYLLYPIMKGLDESLREP